MLIATGFPCAADLQAREGGGIFEQLAGSWGGTGTVKLEGGGVERLRCQASYNPGGETQLSLSIRCASDSFKLLISSNVVRNGNSINGTWQEASFGASGRVVGSVGPNSINASIEGSGASGRLSLSVRGNTQSVTLSTAGQLTGVASVVMRRQ